MLPLFIAMDETTNQPPVLPPAEYVATDESPPTGPPIRKILSFIVGAVVVLILILVFVLVILPTLTPKKTEDVTLLYWGVWEDTAPFETAAEEFHRQNPHVKVTVEKQDIKTLGKYYDRLSTRMDNGTGPDVFRYHNSWITELKSRLLPLPKDVVEKVELVSKSNSPGGVIEGNSSEGKFYPVIYRDLKVNGAYYGVPIHFDTLALFVNSEIFKNAGISSYPSTWDDLTSAARQLTVKEADGRITTAGVALGTYDNIAHASDIISLLLIQNGADLNNLSGPSKQSAYDALDFYTSFARDASKVWDNTLDNSKLAFAKGKLAMYIGYSWDIFEIKAVAPSLTFAIVPVPHLPSRDSTVASYWVEGVSAASSHPKEAFEFIKFLASRENMEKFYTQEAKTRLFGELYPRSDMADQLRENTLIYPFVAQGGSAKSTIFSSDTHDGAGVDSLNVYLGNAVRSMLADNTSAQTAVDTLSQGVSQVQGKYATTK